jgi:hypothetical protein
MITFGFALEYKYAGDGTLLIKTRIPSVHGAYKQSDYNGKPIKNWTADADLPWYPSLLLPHLPTAGEVVAVESINHGNSDWLVLGLTGGIYMSNKINQWG